MVKGFGQPVAAHNGLITGIVTDAVSGKPIPGTTVRVVRLGDSLFSKTVAAGKDGAFMLDALPFGYFRLLLQATGYTPLRIDSIHLRADRFDFELNELKMHLKNTHLEEVIVYAEKPLIESKDGKIIFNTGESALSAGATTTELLKQTPLVSVDNEGKVLMRGKETKILIDDKPVELNAKQLQDLLESMPGSMIEKIEVMTTPPPQYASERGGVINIVTKKGRVGVNGRISINYGTRGEAGLNASFSYRKNKISLNINGGYGYGNFQGGGSSSRQNIYADSVNYLNTNSQNDNLNNRPNARLSLDYDPDKHHSFNLTAQFNSNAADNSSMTDFASVSNANQLYRLSNRRIVTAIASFSPGITVTFTRKFSTPGEQLKIITGVNYNTSANDRDFYQQFLNPDYSFTGNDSTQQQNTRIQNHNISARINYEKPLKNKKIQLGFGGNISRYNSHNTLNTLFMKKPENLFVQNAQLSNDFRFHQTIGGLRTSVRYDIIKDFFVNGGVQAEWTATDFDIKGTAASFANSYISWLPFLTVQKKWTTEVTATFSYKRTIQRPGLNELSPATDYADPYNTRFGNPYLLPSYADNFDWILGKWNKAWFLNMSLGYNKLRNLYSSIRTLQPDGKTTTTWQNISGREEYETSVWGGLTLSKKSKVNLSTGYTWNVYSEFDRRVNRFRNGGSIYTTLNGNYQFTDVLGSNASFTFNRFANPQGTVRSTLSMNLGIQRKFFHKRLTVSLNLIDPFRRQQNEVFTYGPNFNLQSISYTQTRNFRIAIAYSLSKKQHRSSSKRADEKPPKQPVPPA